MNTGFADAASQQSCMLSVKSGKQPCLHPSWLPQVPCPAWASTRRKMKENRVRFSSEVQLIIMGDDAAAQVVTPESHAHQFARTLWHLDGLCCSPGRCVEVAQKWNELAAFSVGWGTGLSSLQHAMPCLLRGNTAPSAHWLASFVPAQDCIRLSDSEGIRAAWQAQQNRQYHFVETWYLESEHHSVCIRSRRFYFQGPLDFDVFKQHCVCSWRDLILPTEDVDIFPVQADPQSLRSTMIHVLVVQKRGQDRQAMLLFADTLPPLQKHRAILVSQKQRFWTHSERPNTKKPVLSHLVLASYKCRLIWMVLSPHGMSSQSGMVA